MHLAPVEAMLEGDTGVTDTILAEKQGAPLHLSCNTIGELRLWCIPVALDNTMLQNAAEYSVCSASTL